MFHSKLIWAIFIEAVLYPLYVLYPQHVYNYIKHFLSHLDTSCSRYYVLSTSTSSDFFSTVNPFFSSPCRIDLQVHLSVNTIDCFFVRSSAHEINICYCDLTSTSRVPSSSISEL
jgi:hypothetical protein